MWWIRQAGSSAILMAPTQKPRLLENCPGSHRLSGAQEWEELNWQSILSTSRQSCLFQLSSRNLFFHCKDQEIENDGIALLGL